MDRRLLGRAFPNTIDDRHLVDVGYVEHTMGNGRC